MNGMPGGFFIYRAEGRKEILYANQALLRILGCSDYDEFRELTGGTFPGLVHPDDLEAVEESILLQIRQNEDQMDYVEYRTRRKDGSIRWLEDYGHYAETEAFGAVFYVFVSDATEKKRRQEQERAALRLENERKEERLRAYDRELDSISREHLRRLYMIEGLSVDYRSIFYADLDADFIQAYQLAPFASSLFPQEKRIRDFSGFVEEYASDWIHPDDRETVLRQLSPEQLRRQLSQNRVVHTNFRSRTGDSVEYLQLRIVSVGGDERHSRILLGTRSVDEEVRHSMEQQEFLSTALQQARTAVEAKNAFLSNMSHDMRTPLNAIAGFTMLARRHAENPEQVRRYLNMIEVSGRQLLRLITNVLEIARIESGGDQLDERPYDLREIARQVHSSLFAQAATKNLTLSLNLDGLREPTVCGDRRRLEQVLHHLASNGVKYTGPGGQVKITVSGPDGPGGYRFVVEDNGIGISKGFLDHLFESFAREQNTTHSGVFGTGLGLPIVKSIVEMMDGDIDVKSEPHKGSRFTVTLPLRPMSEEQAAEAPVSKASGGGKILIVEDNELNMEIARELLEDAGFSVDTAENGRVGLERIRSSRPGEYSLILMDIQMPEMNGYEAARAIRALPQPWLSGLPIVALSANAFEEDKRRSIDSGMDAHMSKPIEIDPLLTLIEKLAGKPKGAAS